MDGPRDMHFSVLAARIGEVPWNQVKWLFIWCVEPAKCSLKWCHLPPQMFASQGAIF